MSEYAPAVKDQSLRRYKSVRQTQKPVVENTSPPPIPVASNQTQNAGLQRSMSRYKARPVPAGTQPPIPKMPMASAMTGPTTNRNGTATNGQHTAGIHSTYAQRKVSGPRAVTDPTPKPLQSPPRMQRQPTASSTGHSQPNTVASSQAEMLSQMMQAQMYALQQAQPQAHQTQRLAPEQKWTNTTALSDLQNEHNRKIKERQRREKETRLRAEEALRKKEEEERKALEEAARKQREEEQREAERKADEQRLIEQKVQAAKKQFSERKKSIRQTSRGLLSRAGSSDVPDMPVRPSVDQYSQASSSRREIRVPTPPEEELPRRQVDAATIARPYQPAPKVRKESISHPRIASVDISPPVRPSIDAAKAYFDAPRSAINVGEHSVIISCNKSNTILTVNNSTTVETLLKSAAKEMPHEKINPATSILLESFEPQGVERRLRRYEHVRDIINTWDADRQNKLLVVPSVTNGKDEDDLFSSKVSKYEPASISVRMQHSSRPGQWDKRVVTLKPGGQICVAKDETGKDERSIATLTDFDIYIPTPQQAKRVRSPKKICFAIKSQQRPGMFITGENFIHWFSTKDRELADQFYVAVQAWRSWYLVARLGMGKSPENKNDTEINAGFLGNVGGIGEMAAAKTTQKQSVENEGFGGGLSLGDDILKTLSSKTKAKDEDNLFSKESLGYDLGGLINRIGSNEYSPNTQKVASNGVNRSGTINRSGTQRNKAGAPALRDRSAPPSSFPQTLMSKLETNEEPTFAPTGLLGKTYSQRQKAAQDGAGAGKEELVWGKPLVDLSATGPAAPPQHARKFSFTTGEGPLIERAGYHYE